VFGSGAFDDPGAERAAQGDVEVNLLGSVRMTRLALPLLRRSDDGAVVLVSSALALVSAPRMAVYAASKAAIHSLARSLRAELDGQVKVFDVLPPWVESDLSHGVAGAKITPDRVAAEIVAGLRRRFRDPRRPHQAARGDRPDQPEARGLDRGAGDRLKGLRHPPTPPGRESPRGSATTTTIAWW
jgi:NAD(P)-dependent dehydrogenase (short-subunit alcohol dehydrogenase family)